MRTLTAADRRQLIRFAATLPAGAAMRRAILAGLAKTTKEARVVFSAQLIAEAIRAIRKNALQNVESVEYPIFSTHEEELEHVYGERPGSWEEPPESLSRMVEVEVPDGGTQEVLLRIPSAIVEQIEPQLREAFMLHVLTELIHQMGADDFLLEVLDLKEPVYTALRENRGITDITNLKISKGKVEVHAIPGAHAKADAHHDHVLKVNLVFRDLEVTFDFEMETPEVDGDYDDRDRDWDGPYGGHSW